MSEMALLTEHAIFVCFVMPASFGLVLLVDLIFPLSRHIVKVWLLHLLLRRVLSRLMLAHLRHLLHHLHLIRYHLRLHLHLWSRHW